MHIQRCFVPTRRPAHALRMLVLGALALVAVTARAVVPALVAGSSDLANYTNTPWSLQKTGTFVPGSPTGTGTVNWTVTVTKGTPTAGLAAKGYVDITNNTPDAVPITGFVVNLQRIVGGDYATVTSDIADNVSGDAATSATVDPDITYEGHDTFTENAASASLGIYDASGAGVALNSPVQSVAAHATVRLFFAANFNAGPLNIATGEPLQIEVIVNFPTSFVMPSLSTLTAVTAPAPTAYNDSATLVDNSITASGTATTGTFGGLNQVVLASGAFPVTLTVDGGLNGGTVCNTAVLSTTGGTISYVLNGTPVPLIVLAPTSLSKSDCQTIPKHPGGPKPTTTTINSCSQVVTYDASLFTSDAGTIVSASFTPASGSTFPFGTSTIGYVVTDSAGNTATGNLTVNVIDSEAPVITPVNNINVPTDQGKCTAAVTYATTATDCNLQSLTYSPASGSEFPIGTSVVTITATDTAGHQSTSTFSVTVRDTTAPVLHVGNVQANVTPGTCGAAVAFAATADDCSAVSLVYSLAPDFSSTIASGANFPIGTTLVYVQATDAAGNVSTASFTVTVVDNEAPVLTVADIRTNVTPATCGANVTFTATAKDCGEVTLVYSLAPDFSAGIASGANFPIGTTTVYVKATDKAGNSATSSFKVTVVDNEAPVISVTNVMANVTPGTCGAAVTFAATAKDCGQVTLAYSLAPDFSTAIASGANFPIGSTTVYVKATDSAGNVSTSSFQVVVIDNQPPVIAAPNIQTTVTPGTCTAAVSFAASAADCSGAVLTYSLSPTFSPALTNGGTFPVGTTVVYVRAVDGVGNVSSTSFNVTVIDNQAPVITAPNLQVNNSADTCGAAVTFNATATDCSAVTLVYSLDAGFTTTVASGANFPVGTTTVYVRATDAAGNAATKSFTVTVKDTQPPTITSPLTNLSLHVDANKCYATFTYIPTAMDNCGGAVTVTASPAYGTQLPAGTTTTVTVTATDSYGNTITKTFTVTVEKCPITQTTYTQGGWGAVPQGNNPGTILWKYFSTVYPSGLVIGGNYKVTFTCASAITNALPLTGTPAVLTKNYTDPLVGNTFMSQTVALKLNVDFSSRGFLPVNYGSLGAMKLTTGKLAGWTVTQVLALCNKVLGGQTSALPAGVSVSDLTNIEGAINGNFDNAGTNNGYLMY